MFAGTHLSAAITSSAHTRGHDPEPTESCVAAYRTQPPVRSASSRGNDASAPSEYDEGAMNSQEKGRSTFDLLHLHNREKGRSTKKGKIDEKREDPHLLASLTVRLK